MSVPDSLHAAAQEAQAQNGLVDNRIRRAIASGLAAKGIMADDENPAFLVVYHTGAEDKVSVTDWGYLYGPGPWGYNGRDIDVRQYTKGTLIIDFVDAGTRELVWRGAATRTLDPNANQEQRGRTINEAVAGLLKSWPPSGRTP